MIMKVDYSKFADVMTRYCVIAMFILIAFTLVDSYFFNDQLYDYIKPFALVVLFLFFVGAFIAVAYGIHNYFKNN